jgi:hypothetical protein
MGAKGVVTNECLRLNTASGSGTKKKCCPVEVEGAERGVKSNEVNRARSNAADD